jgi:glucose-6-phosphate 1-dehydrogenase
VKAYGNEPNVAANFNIETYVAMALEIDNWGWAGVPIFSCGKHLSQRMTEIAIRFKARALRCVPAHRRLRANWLVLSIAQDERISLIRGQTTCAGGGPCPPEDGIPR